jgi:O-antigen ligase
MTLWLGLFFAQPVLIRRPLAGYECGMGPRILPPAPPLARAALLILVALLPVAFWRGALEPFESTKAGLLHLLALLLVGLFAGARAWPGRFWREPIGLAVLLSFVSALASTAFSISPRTSVWGAWQCHQGVLTAAALLVVFLASRSVFSPSHARSVAWALTVAVTLCAGYAFLQLIRLDPLPWVSTSDYAGFVRPIGTMGHPNYLAGFLVMALPLLVWLGRDHPRRLLLPGALAVVAVVASLSRAAWLAGVLVLPLPLVLLSGRRRLIAGGVLAVMGAALVLAACLPGPVGERVRHLGDGSARLAIWQTGWRVFLDSPVLGSGPDTFQFAFPAHRNADYWDLEWGMTPNRAHNDPLHLLATQGAAGGLCYLLLAAAVVVSLGRAWRRQPDQRGLLLALAGVSLAYHVQNLFGFPVIATAALHAVALGFLSRLGDAEEATEADPKPTPAWLPPLVAAGVLCAAWFVVYRPFACWCLLRTGEVALDRAPDDAIAACEGAVENAPWLDVPHAHLAVARHRAALARGTFARGAADASRRACELVPACGHHHALHARILLDVVRQESTGQDELWRAYDEALARDPDNPLTLIDAARAALMLNQNDRARAYLDRAATLGELPQLTAERGVLALSEGRAGEAEQLLHEAVKGDWHGQVDARGRAHGLLALACLHHGNDHGALTQAEEVLRVYPPAVASEPTTRFVRASALERLGRRDEARQEFGRVLSLRPDHGPAREALDRLGR